MAYQKTDGTRQDAEYIVNRLRDGFSYEEAISGMVMPIDPGTPERPGWCYRNKKLFMDWAENGMPAPGGMLSVKKVIGHVSTPDGKVWALHPDNTRTEIVASVEEAPPIAPEPVREVSPGLPNPVKDSAAARKSRKKLVPKEFP